MDGPYPGTRPFRQADCERFSGRVAAAGILASLWQANDLTVAVGPAGSGKTSLLHAGVFPLVADGRSHVLPPGQIAYGSTFPTAALPEHNPYTLALLRAWSPGEAAARLVGLTVADFVRRRARRHDGVILAVIDQVEGLLADVRLRSTHRRRFLGELTEALAAEPRFHLLVLVRDEVLGLISDALGHGAQYRVRPLNSREAVEAVTRPVAGTGRSYAPEAAAKLVSGLQTSRIVSAEGTERYVTDVDVEPALLQVVCAQLWESLPPDLENITAREVRRYADADMALAAHCGRVIAAVADDHDLSVTRLRSWLLGTFITSLGTRGSAYEGPSGTAGMANAVVRALEDQHLLSAVQRSGTRWYELLSDRLIEPLRQAPDMRPSPTLPATYLSAAQRALTLGELDLAEQYAQAILSDAAGTDLRSRAEANSLLGNFAHEREEWAEAEARYLRAAELYEAVRDTGAVALQLAAVGQTLLAQGQLAEAVAELRAAASRLPNDAMAHTELALALWQQGHGRAAVAVLTSALEIDGGNPGALWTRGEILADLGDAREALFDLDRLTLRHRPATRAARGLALAVLGDHPAASEEIDAALTGAERNGPVLFYAARAAALHGDEAAAEGLARRAVDAPDPPLSPQHHDLALRLVGDSEKASLDIPRAVVNSHPAGLAMSA